jgi:hypothetical protein
MIRPRTETPWRNNPPRDPLPPEHPDKFCWVPGEIAFGKPPSAPTLPPTEPQAGQEQSQ